MCNDCGNESVDLFDVIVFDLTDTDPGKMSWQMCQACLEEKNLWCHSHGLKVLLYMPEFEDSGDNNFPVFTFCWQCCRDEVATIEICMLSSYADMIREYYQGEDLDWIIQMGKVATEHSKGRELGIDDRVILGACIVGAITGKDLSQTLVAMAQEEGVSSIC